MKRIQPMTWIAAGVAVIAGTAIADVADTQRTKTTTVDVQQESEECRQFRQLPADTTSDIYPWAQRLSYAACRQAITVKPVRTTAGLEPMVTELRQAAQPSIDIYKDALCKGPASVRMLAAYALGKTYEGIAVRARNAIAGAGGRFGGGRYGGGRYGGTASLSNALEPLIASDLAQALASFEQVKTLARSFPNAARSNQVVMNVIRQSCAEVIALRQVNAGSVQAKR